MRRVLELCANVAPTRATVLITGETGTGKELIARLVHARSPRRDKPLVACHCAAIPETLLESELFGHERGAFTDALQSRAGLFERGDGGTLLLDEVGDIPPPAQAKLLRVIQEGRFSRLGATRSQASDVRIVATTRHNLPDLVQRGRFREDLYYRLSTFPIRVPPLRERREDVAILATRFLESAARRNRCEHAGISETAITLLISHNWPGNVRELQSTVERALLLAQAGQITQQHLPAELLSGFVPPRAGESASSLAYAQRLIVARALHEHGWNLTRAADRLGVSVDVLKRMISRLELHRG